MAKIEILLVYLEDFDIHGNEIKHDQLGGELFIGVHLINHNISKYIKYRLYIIILILYRYNPLLNTMDPNIRAFGVQFDTFMEKLKSLFPNEKLDRKLRKF